MFEQNYKEFYVPTNLGNIHLMISGSGPTMFFWPSLLMDASMWEHQEKHFNKDYQVILMDGPCHGKSESINRHFSIEECALCLSQIMDYLKVDRGIIVGNSWGGMVGSVFAALYPHRTVGTVLMNCTASVAPLKQKMEFFMMALLSKKITHLPKVLVHNAVKAFIGISTEKNRKSVVTALVKKLGQVNIQSAKWAVESIVAARRDQHELLKQIKSPCLVIAGEEDRTFPVAEVHNMAKAIPGCTFEVLDGVGHSAAIENPQLVNERIDAFLNLLKERKTQTVIK